MSVHGDMCFRNRYLFTSKKFFEIIDIEIDKTFLLIIKVTIKSITTNSVLTPCVNSNFTQSKIFTYPVYNVSYRF